MSGYVSKEEVKSLFGGCVAEEYPSICKAVNKAIDCITNADVRENIPIKFIPVNVDCRGYTETFRCSKCGCDITAPYVMQELDYDFCPWCGGKAE